MAWANLKPSKVQLVSLIALLVSGGMLGLSVYMVYSIDVLKEWTLTVPKQTIRVGDEIVVSSVYNKVRDATGVAERYLDCKNQNNVFIRYPVNKAVANRAAKAGGTGIVMIMPKVPNLPTTCKVSVAINYDVLKIGDFVIRSVHESNESNEFTLEEAISEEDESTQTSQAQVSAFGELRPELDISSDVSSSQNTLITDAQQSNSSQEQQPDPSFTATASQPTLLERIITPVTNLLGEG